MTKLLISLALLIFSTAAYSTGSANQPGKKQLTAALQKYLQQQGDFCLGKFDWPIDVSESDDYMHTRDAIQMPVLEKHGLVTMTTGASAIRKVGDSDIPVPVKRYELSETGKKYYLPREAVTRINGKDEKHTHDFCAGKLSLDKIVGWSKPAMHGDSLITTVNYTYRIAAADWSHDAEIQKVFPMLARIVNGGGKVRLEQNFKQEGKNWVAVNPWQ
ncbi:MAG: hypothetical protein PHW13_12760 [Methylococcales bacterium]|nr:hypothetical protein [Methylococcales bacterium]